MSDKERLEEINNFSSLPLKKRISLTKESIKKELKSNDYHMPKNININTQYLLEIIEQAERVQELDEEVDRLKVWYGAYHRETKATSRLRDENKRLREALEFYADENNYREHDLKGIVPPRPIAYKPILHDYGSIARQALESNEN